MSPSPAGIFVQAHTGIRRAAVRRQLQSIADGRTTTLDVRRDLGLDVGGIVDEITRGKELDSAAVENLGFAFVKSGTADYFVGGLSAKNPDQRVRSARLVSALRMYEAVPWLAGPLQSRDRKVSDAAARALGRVGGANSARAILRAIQRRGLTRRLVAELARSAPDLFVESALSEPQRPMVRPALALAAGLRRRRAAVAPLMSLVEQGSRRERVISCRALGWIGSMSAAPLLTAALQDEDWKTRMSAAKALGALHARSAVNDLKYLQQIDRNARVRAAAKQALRRIREAPVHGA